VDHTTEIVPLARRLAEENNVDWRRLRGSGEQGRVVERDVLEYLARVMAGVEDVDPTPEPVPEGMVAWPEADVHAHGQGHQRYEEGASESPATVDDEILLLEPDLHDDLLLDPPLADDGAPTYGYDDDDDDGLLVAGDDLAPSDAGPPLATQEGDAPAAHAPMPGVPADALEVSRSAATATSEGEPSWGVGEEAEELPDLFDSSPTSRAWEDAPVFDDPSALDEPPHPGPSLFGGDERGDERSELALTLGDDVAASSDEAVDVPMPVPAPVPTPLPAPAAATGEAVQGVASLPLVRHGAVWRRQVDLTPLVAAQLDVGRDLGRGEPVPLVAFLARAAAKALQEGSEVGVVLLGEYAVHTTTVDALSGSFATLVATMARRSSLEALDDGEVPGIFVADLSELEIDEAVLHLAAPVLTLGRVLVDSSTGGRRATLSLSGDAVGRDAARVLAKVAELLESPVRIVL
jgi:hypothetical protein